MNDTDHADNCEVLPPMSMMFRSVVSMLYERLLALAGMPPVLHRAPTTP